MSAIKNEVVLYSANGTVIKPANLELKKLVANCKKINSVAGISDMMTKIPELVQAIIGTHAEQGTAFHIDVVNTILHDVVLPLDLLRFHGNKNAALLNGAKVGKNDFAFAKVFTFLIMQTMPVHVSTNDKVVTDKGYAPLPVASINKSVNALYHDEGKYKLFALDKQPRPIMSVQSALAAYQFIYAKFSGADFVENGMVFIDMTQAGAIEYRDVSVDAVPLCNEKLFYIPAHEKEMEVSLMLRRDDLELIRVLKFSENVTLSGDKVLDRLEKEREKALKVVSFDRMKEEFEIGKAKPQVMDEEELRAKYFAEFEAEQLNAKAKAKAAKAAKAKLLLLPASNSTLIQSSEKEQKSA
jgi:hypothetical protein